MSNYAIEVVNVSKQYSPDARNGFALHDVSLVVPQKEHVYIFGRSGGGKTTLAKIIAGIESPTTGLVRINDMDPHILKKSKRKLYSQTIHLLQQNSYQTFDPRYSIGYTLSEQVGIHCQSVPRKERLSFIGSFLNKNNMADLCPLLKKHPTELSGGQLQRFSAIRACLVSPKILIADEPTSMLDKENTERVVQLLKDSFCERTMLLISHDSNIRKDDFSRCFSVLDGSISEIV